MSIEENLEPEEPADTTSDAEELEQRETSSQEKRRSSVDAKSENCNSKPHLEEKLSAKMFVYARETMCFFLAIAFTALAALHSSPPRISKPPVARPFFNESSLILDFYKGHLGALVDRVSEADFSFVMYYAPWDAECQALKEEFENVAQYYHSQVFFAAINCWHPGSECRARYSKIHSYPVVMLYPSRESGIQYKGITSAPYMIRFIHRFMNPIIRVTNDEQLMDLIKSYDAVVIGYFDFVGLSRSPGYKEFYKAALRILEKDPNGEIAFVAITNIEIAQNHGITYLPSASLLMWNETLFYPDDNKWSADSLSNWINNNIHRVVTWLQPPGSKSLTLAPYLWDGPVLFLFTPRNPLHFENDYYNLLKEVGLQYYDCSGNLQIEDTISRLRKSRLEAPLKAFDKREWCMNIIDEKVRYSSFTGSVVRNTSQNRWTNNTVNCCSDIPTNKCVMCTRQVDDPIKICLAPGAACRDTDIFGLPLGFNEQKGDVLHDFAFINVKRPNDIDGTCSAESCEYVVKPDEETDPQSATAVKKAFYKEECRRFLAGYSYQRPVFPMEDGEDTEEIRLTDDICKINKTLALVAIDSLHYYHFAEGLGVDVVTSRDKTAAVILDPADESQYVMQDEFGRNSLVQFINNYTHGYLRRTMRSHKAKRSARTAINESKCTKKTKTNICVPELTTDTFLDTVLNPDKDVIVMYHSPYCAFCNAVSYVYLTVAQYLSRMDHLEFVRIDGDNNDLPWEYTMNRYPSILFFPAKRKEDSTLFPRSLQVSVGNLLGFVLANLDEESHVEALVNVCAAGVGGSAKNCLSRARSLCLDILEEHLRDLRRLKRIRVYREAKRLLNDRKRILMLKLEHDRDIHLTLSLSHDLLNDETKVELIRKKFKQFYKKLRKLQHEQSRFENRTTTYDERDRSEHIL